MDASETFMAKITGYDVIPTITVRKFIVTLRAFKSHLKPLSLMAVYFVFFL